MIIDLYEIIRGDREYPLYSPEIREKRLNSVKNMIIEDPDTPHENIDLHN